MFFRNAGIYLQVHNKALQPRRTKSTSNNNIVGFEVLTAASVKMAAFWVVAPCSLVEVYQRFRGTCCLHRPDDGGSKDL
jgi:hypothetical protein